MAYNYEYPYTDISRYNSDWILHRIKQLTDDFVDFVKVNRIKYANPIEWNIEHQYEQNTVVIDAETGDAYLSVKEVPNGVSITNTEYWTPIYNYSVTMDELREQIAIANEKGSPTATAQRAIDDLVWLNGKLYVVTAPMIAGDSYVEGSNCEKTTIEDEIVKRLAKLKIYVDNGDVSIKNYADTIVADLRSYVNTQDTALGNRITALSADLNGKINTLRGDMEDAIDEIEDELGQRYLFVKTSAFSEVDDAVQFAHAHNIYHVKMDRNETIHKPIALWSGMDFDGCGHTISCASNFVGTRVFTNMHSGYWNDTKAIYLPYCVSGTTTATDRNIHIHDMRLGDYYRSNNDYRGNNIGSNTGPRGWFAFDRVMFLEINDIHGEALGMGVESFVWLTQTQHTEIHRNIFKNDKGISNTGGCIWIYNSFDSEQRTASFRHHIHSNYIWANNDEGVAIRSYYGGVTYDVWITDNYFYNITTGQGLTFDSDNLVDKGVTVISGNRFYNAGIRFSYNYEDVSIDNCKFYSSGPNVSNQGYQIRTYRGESGADNVKRMTMHINNCRFQDFRNYNGAVYISNAWSLEVTGCTFIGTGSSVQGDALSISDTRTLAISGCNFWYWENGILIDNPTTGGLNQTVSGCSFLECTNAIYNYSKCHELNITGCTSTACTSFFNNNGSECWCVKLSENMVKGGTGHTLYRANKASSGPVIIDNNYAFGSSSSASLIATGSQVSDTHLCFKDNYYGTTGATASTMSKYTDTLS